MYLSVMSSSDSTWFLFFFFFQAEDGIRDLVRSRGLGDVYKRQTEARNPQGDFFDEEGLEAVVVAREWDSANELLAAVSYTHLTLPTSDLV